MRTTKSNKLSTIHFKYMIFAKTMVEIPFVENKMPESISVGI